MLANLRSPAPGSARVAAAVRGSWWGPAFESRCIKAQWRARLRTRHAGASDAGNERGRFRDEKLHLGERAGVGRDGLSRVTEAAGEGGENGAVLRRVVCLLQEAKPWLAVEAVNDFEQHLAAAGVLEERSVPRPRGRPRPLAPSAASGRDSAPA